MRCPDCCKFVSYDEPSVDVDDIEITEDGHITGQVHVELPCAECGTTLKEAYLDIDHQIATTRDHDEKECGTSVEVTSTDSIVEIGGRHAKTYYGAMVTVKANCECGAIDMEETEIVVKDAAGNFEEVAS